MRSTSLALLTLVLGLLLGAGFGFLLGSGGSVEASGRSEGVIPLLQPEVDSNGLGASPPTDPDLGEVGALPRIEFGEDQERQPGELSPGELARAESAAASALSRVSATPAGEESEWTGVITGTVVDEVGAPVPGATVVSNGAQSWYSAEVTANSTDSVGRAFPGIKALEEELDSYAESRVKNRKRVRTAVTDAAGAFTLEGLESGTHPLRGYLEGHVISQVNVTTGSAGQLIANRVGAFEFDVRLPDGSQPDEAVVMVLDDRDREEAAGKWSREEPVVRFSNTRIRCRVIAGEPRKVDWKTVAAEYSSSMMTLDLDADGSGPHVVELALETQLRVTVVDESSIVPRVEPWVKVQSTADEGESSTPLKRYQSGPFIAASLEPGSYELTIGRGKSAPEVTMAIEIGAGLNEQEVTLGDVDYEGFIVVSCKGSDGVPLTSVEFSYTSTNENGSSRSGGMQTIPRAPGEYLVDRSQFDGPGANTQNVKTLEVTAKSSVMGQITQRFDPSGSAIDFVFEEPGDVAVQVTGNLTGDLYVKLVPVKEEGEDSTNLGWGYHRRARGNGKVDRNGLAQLGLTQPGKYDLELTAQENEWGQHPAIASLQVTVQPGKNQLSIAAPVLAELSVHAPDIEVGASFHLQLKSSGGRRSFSGAQKTLDDEHRVLFEGLAHGDYILYVWGETQGQMELTVPCGEILFVADEVKAYEVVSVVKDKLAAKAGLAEGDLILAVNGHQVEGTAFMNRLWVELADGPATLQVQRGGREVQIELEEMGGSANPWSAFGANLTPRAGRN